ncbi:TonB-dependent receptor-like protein [Aquimarina sp. MAR_2010_214]|uniref:TonB-dependent receptor n=1 Tax=Aquimarina sp. MAR_2010_214 TaxID=1250026 RepID=UPI000C701B98|nr:TonB-dependent receptor [Aquimarina sp. MAR_2010_214]PKV51798.1 TonB-dependent receptor-like protein [Aquimarina sp. MAR_2010_214]
MVRVLFLVLFIGWLDGYAQETILDQKISLVKENVSISSVLSELETTLDFTIGYSDSAIDLSKVISISIRNKTLAQVLKTIFPSKLYQFKLLGKKLLIYKRPKKYTISGYISEKGSQEYLSSVSIYIPELNAGTITNDYGFYSLSIPEGSYQVLISFVGYKSIKKNIDLVSDRVINFDLELDTQYLDEVIINSDQETNKSQVTQMSSERLNPSIFEDIPTILGEKDAIKTLQLLPGVQSGGEGSAGFYVRGGTPDQNLIILDEATVYNSNHLFGIFSIFNGDAIKSVEIFKGGFPARFGGRLSSVVKIDTKNGNKEKFTGKANISLISSSLVLEGPIIKGKTSFVISGRRTYADLLLLPFMSKEYKLIEVSI